MEEEGSIIRPKQLPGTGSKIGKASPIAGATSIELIRPENRISNLQLYLPCKGHVGATE